MGHEGDQPSVVRLFDLMSEQKISLNLQIYTPFKAIPFANVIFHVLGKADLSCLRGLRVDISHKFIK